MNPLDQNQQSIASRAWDATNNLQSPRLQFTGLNPSDMVADIDRKIGLGGRLSFELSKVPQPWTDTDIQQAVAKIKGDDLIRQRGWL